MPLLQKSEPKNVPNLLYKNSKFLLIFFLILTFSLIIPFINNESNEIANQNPKGSVFDLQETINQTFASPLHGQWAIAESKSGDILTAESLNELLQNQNALINADLSGLLAPGSLEKQPYLAKYFNPATQTQTTAVISVANVVENILQNDTRLDTKLSKATDQQVKFAIHLMMSDKSKKFQQEVETISIKATKEKKVVLGEEIDWWVSPAIIVITLSDNQKLGGGSYEVAVTGDPTAINKEKFDRNVQKYLRGKEINYRLWSIAIDINLESEKQGQQAGIFITLTVIAALLITGLVLNSYWAFVLTSFGIGSLIIWLKGISTIIGIKTGLINDLIVPIAMIALGVDFAIHAIRRFQEELKTFKTPKKAYVYGLSGLITAITLAFISDSIAFLANVTSQIEAVVHFGLSAAIAVTSSFIVLGLIIPLTFSKILEIQTKNWGISKRSKFLKISICFLTASLTGVSVILMVAVNPLYGSILLIISGMISIVIPLKLLQNPKSNSSPTITNESSLYLYFKNKFNTNFFEKLILFFPKYKFLTIVFFGGITIISILNAIKLEPTFNIEDFFDSKSDFVVGLDKLEIHNGDRGGEPAIAYFEGDLTNPNSIKNILIFLDNLKNNQNIGHLSNGDPYISQPNIISIIQNNTNSKYTLNLLSKNFNTQIQDSNLDGIPDSKKDIETILNFSMQRGVYNNNGEMIFTPESIYNIIRKSEDSYVTQIIIGIPGTRDLRQISKAWKSLNSDFTHFENQSSIYKFGLTGSPFTRKEQLEATTKSLQRSIPIAAISALIVLTIAMRSFKYALITVIPIGLVVAWLYSIMQLLGFGLNLVTATIGAISIGIGIDYSIHITQRFREEISTNSDITKVLKTTINGTGIALLGSAASSIIGFLIMGFAPMPMFSSFGILTAIMILMSLLAALLVLPTLLLITTKKDLKKL
ncbi:MAG: MMPL family transporter [Dehalococcoidia bacterium]